MEWKHRLPIGLKFGPAALVRWSALSWLTDFRSDRQLELGHSGPSQLYSHVTRVQPIRCTHSPQETGRLLCEKTCMWWGHGCACECVWKDMNVRVSV